MRKLQHSTRATPRHHMQQQGNTMASYAAAGQHHGIIRSSRATPRHHTQQQGNTMKPHASAGHYHGAVYGHCHGLIQQQGTATALYSSTRALPRPYTVAPEHCHGLIRPYTVAVTISPGVTECTILGSGVLRRAERVTGGAMIDGSLVERSEEVTAARLLHAPAGCHQIIIRPHKARGSSGE